MDIKLKLNLNFFDYFLIIGVTISSLCFSFLTNSFDIVGTIAAISGLCCVVLVAKRNILNYIFGVINVSLYAYISFKADLFGDAALNALYYFPMQFIGFFSWIRKKDENPGIVKSHSMTAKQRLIWSISSLIIVVIVGFILKHFGDTQPFKDSATTVLSIIAMFFMVRAYMEQWVFWIIVNIISVIMWIIAASHGETHAELMIIMWIFYLANSINGLRVWHKASKLSFPQ